MASPFIELESTSRVRQAYFDGCALHGDLGLSRERFQSRIATIIEKHLGPSPKQTAVLGFFDALHTEDLYLATACADMSETAWYRFDLIYRPHIYKLALFSRLNPDIAGDLTDTVMTALFLSDGSGNRRIATFDGKCPLADWLAMIVRNRVIDEGRCKSNNFEPIDSLSELADTSCVERMNATVRARCYDRIIRDTFTTAFAALTVKERRVLKKYYKEGLKLADIAEESGTSPSNLSHKVKAIRLKLRKEILSILTGKYGLCPAQVEECVDEVLENPSHSILDLIGDD